MKIENAARTTFKLIMYAYPTAKAIRSTSTHTEINHILWMLEGIISGYVQHEKAHRWLGWAQGIIVDRNITVVERMKEINRDSDK